MLIGYLQKLFSIADVNRDGVLSPVEFADLLSRSGFNFEPAVVIKLVKEADVNHDGVNCLALLTSGSWSTPSRSTFGSNTRLCLFGSCNDRLHCRNELVVLDHSILICICLQENLQDHLSWETKPASGQQLQERLWLKQLPCS